MLFFCNRTPDDASIEINEIATSKFSSNGVWSQYGCTLVLSMVQDVAANEKLDFWVEFRNPAAEGTYAPASDRLLRDAATVNVSASAVCTNEIDLDNNPSDIDLTTNQALPTSSAGSYQV